MKKYKLYSIVLLMIFSISLVRANENQSRGIDLEEYAFGIPANQLGFNTYSSFTLSFWVNVKEFYSSEYGTQFVNIREMSKGWPSCDYGYLWSNIVNQLDEDSGNKIQMTIRDCMSAGTSSTEVYPTELNSSEWKHFSFVFDNYVFSNRTYRNLILYIDGILSHTLLMPNCTYSWQSEFIIMIGGPSWDYVPLNAYIDKVQFYKKALSQEEVIESMTSPLLNDESLLGYWDFEEGCTTDAEGYMPADNGTIKATMYKILSNSGGESIGAEIQPFTFGEGVNPESVIEGVKESIAEESNTKAYVSNGILYIESSEDITSVKVYDAMGREILANNPTPGETSVEIALPTVKGVLIVKVNSEAIKVISNK